MFNGESPNDDQNIEKYRDDDFHDLKNFLPFAAGYQSKFFVILIYIASMIVISGILFGIALVWQWRFDLLAICNAFYFSAFMLFTFSLIVYASNNNIFAPLIYGTKTFFLMFVGRRPKLSYYDYFQDSKNHLMPKYLIFYPLIACIPNFIVAITLHIIYNTQIYPYLYMG